MYERLQDIGKALSTRKGDVLSISHSAKLVDVLAIEPTSFVEANYPDHNFLSLVPLTNP